MREQVLDDAARGTATRCQPHLPVVAIQLSEGEQIAQRLQAIPLDPSLDRGVFEVLENVRREFDITAIAI